MPSYESILLLKKLAKPELAQILKRSATTIYNTNGALLAIENLGTRRLPFRISSHGRSYKEGSYFLLRFDAPATSIRYMLDEFKRDVDVIRSGVMRIEPDEKIECTLDEELKPPAYRKEVQTMIEQGRKVNKYKFKPNTGLDYNPFRT